MPTVHDVARLAGVSTATVSRVLSNAAVVKPQTRSRVLKAINELDYALNNNAKSLRTTKTSKILVTVPNISNPFYGSVIRGVEEAAQDAGYAVLLGDTHNNAKREDEYGAMLHRREADGLIFLGHRLPSSLQQMVESLGSRAPVVNGCEFSPELGVPSVHIDNRLAAEEAMQLIYEHGHIDVGIITGTLRSPLSRDRLAGVRAAAARHSLADRLHVVTGDFSVQSGLEGAAELLAHAPALTAMFCFSDEMAMGAMAACRAAGLNCPNDVSIVGFDDIRYSEYMDVPLTTISQPMHEIGRGTVGLLVELLRSDGRTISSVTLPHRIITRASLASARKR
jgi:LacI family repressor for deo operon, udp, cdd, tsx, nupC, and nupG